MDYSHHIDRTTGYMGSAAEDGFLYVQAVRSGSLLFLSGQASLDKEGQVVGPNDMAVQIRQTYKNIDDVLARFGCTFTDLIEETAYVTDIRAAGPILAEERKTRFGGKPQAACTLVEVQALGLPELTVEIRAVAGIPQGK